MQLGYEITSLGYGIVSVLLVIGVAVCCVGVKCVLKKIIKGDKDKAGRE